MSVTIRPMASCTAPSPDAQAGRRRHSRLRVSLPARLITLDGTFHVTLLNLSFRGAKIVANSPDLRRGAKGVLTWAGYEAFCKIAWTAKNQCGLDFDQPLKPHMLIETRDLADAAPRVDARRVAAQNWASGLASR